MRNIYSIFTTLVLLFSTHLMLFATDSMTFENGEKLLVQFDPAIQTPRDLAIQYFGTTSQSAFSGNPLTECVITFTAQSVISQGGNDVLHWQIYNGSWNWQHNGVEWAKVTATAISGTNAIPCRPDNTYTILYISLDGSGNSIYTWKQAVDPAIDGCGDCFLITED